MKGELTMVSSTRQAVACILLIIGASLIARSQTIPAKEGTASIAGKVTIKGEGVSGIPVFASASNYTGPQTSGYRTITDQDGSYRISNVAPGNYRVMPLAPAYVTVGEARSLMLSEGEAVDNINFTLVRGGVITGKVTDSDGQPLIEEQISMEVIDEGRGTVGYFQGWSRTDDRGVYRIFAVRAGKYKVSAGGSGNRGPIASRQAYQQTFYPSVTDPAKATVIEVTEGSETKNVDIVVGQAVTTFTANGRIVDGESGKPLSNVRYGVAQIHDGGSHSSLSDYFSNAEGEFKLENLLPGKYSVFISGIENSEMRTSPVSFEIIDRDVTGLLVKASRGATLSGVVVIEGVEKKTAAASLGELYISANVSGDTPEYGAWFPTQVKPDGTFRIMGLRAGMATISFPMMGWGRRVGRQLDVVRVERNGIIVAPHGIELREGEHVSGLRVIAKHLTGGLRGIVKVENGELPPNAHISVWLNRLENDSAKTMRGNPSPEVDSRGRFVAEGLPSGTYEVNAMIMVASPDGRGAHGLAKQQVVVIDNTVTEVTISVELKTNTGQRKP